MTIKESDVQSLFLRFPDYKLEPINNSSNELKLIDSSEIKSTMNSSAFPNGKATGLPELSYGLIKQICKREESCSLLGQ